MGLNIELVLFLCIFFHSFFVFVFVICGCLLTFASLLIGIGFVIRSCLVDEKISWNFSVNPSNVPEYLVFLFQKIEL